ncbi:LysR family transcriptional regulator [Glaciecola sp. MH2013]|uniref:LysR family transcriptional regulator n=1 Tax=Glaciecola sp. MH2013 TaxID=2785524 RepID=UPI00189C860C|nr:LysR family transcriptional regulator [Glaciecola sp. MH2013]MBF7073535.1 LysR family transcriptional regulator [Glaciecola sp. MH2013]
MDTKSIKLFVLAAELLNIGAAGSRLGFSPAVASARLAKLELELGADLFHRSTRKVTLSIEGAEFLPFAQEMIAQEEASLAALGRRNPKVSGTLRFAASSTFAERYIAPILPEFLDMYPDVNLELKLSDTQVNLIDGGFDLALRNSAVEDSSLIGRRLFQDTRILCASPDYLSKHSSILTPEDLDNHQLILFINSKPRKLKCKTAQRDCTFPPNKAKHSIVCDDGATIRRAALAGVGICMSSLWNVNTEIAEGTLARVLPDYFVEDNAAVWLVYPKSNVITPKVRVFIDFLVDKLADINR